MKIVKILALEERSEILRKKEENGNRIPNWNIFFEYKLSVISDNLIKTESFLNKLCWKKLVYHLSTAQPITRWGTALKVQHCLYRQSGLHPSSNTMEATANVLHVWYCSYVCCGSNVTHAVLHSKWRKYSWACIYSGCALVTLLWA